MMNRVERNAAREFVAAARQMLQLFEGLLLQDVGGYASHPAEYATYTRLRNAVQVMESLLND